MGIIKQWQLEEAERERIEHLEEVQRYLDEAYPDEDWDAEVWEDYQRALEKGD